MRVLSIAGLCLLALSFPLSHAAPSKQPAAANVLPLAADAQNPSAQTGPVLLTPSQLEPLLPATVYFRGKTASIQLRNSGGVRFGPDGYFLATMVDNSGYASSVQEKYQVYLIAEIGVKVGGQHLSPGAYGAGLVNGELIVMDLGGHTLLQAKATQDQSMARPRPLQLVSSSTGEVRLYFGRSWITVTPETLP